MAEFELDVDPTRWGRGDGGGLSPQTAAFLSAQVGPGNPQSAPVWDDVRVPATRASGEDVQALADVVGTAHVDVSDDGRRRRAGGLSYLDLVARRADAISAPDVVVLPGSAAEVAAVLRVAEDRGLAVVTFGGGTSVVGGLRTGAIERPVISLDTGRMADVLDIDAESMLVTVGPGIIGPDLERILATRGLTLGHFPQSWQRATIGGYAATRSAGQASTGYGRSDEMIESIELVTPRGTLQAGRVERSAAGPDLRGLVIGSEGAFGVITRVTLRVRPLPSSTSYTAVVFGEYHRGVAAFRELAQRRTTADVMRLSDPEETQATLAMSAPGGKAGAALDAYLRARRRSTPSMAILGWEGDRATVAARRLASLRVLRHYGAVSLGPTVGGAWHRHRFDGPLMRDSLMDAGYLVETLETATTWSRLTDLRQSVREALTSALSTGGRSPWVMSHISHVYDTSASLYVTVVTPAADDPAGQWRAAKERASDAIAAAGATITHHHAIGRDHAPWLAAELGPVGVHLLRAIKAQLDPAGVLNPGVLGLD
ncbi:MAG: FAD-binding oxidoreductase [Candidatus Nanopelagicales bacterium]